MKTNEAGIEKFKGKKGPIYRVQIRKKGYKHQSRSFSNFREAKKWKLMSLPYQMAMSQIQPICEEHFLAT
ncbi:MAG: hypothetical protein Tsb0021_05850 [Chlamydiales bacterium]